MVGACAGWEEVREEKERVLDKLRIKTERERNEKGSSGGGWTGVG